MGAAQRVARSSCLGIPSPPPVSPCAQSGVDVSICRPLLCGFVSTSLICRALFRPVSSDQSLAAATHPHRPYPSAQYGTRSYPAGSRKGRCTARRLISTWPGDCERRNETWRASERSCSESGPGLFLSPLLVELMCECLLRTLAQPSARLSLHSAVCDKLGSRRSATRNRVNNKI